MEDPIFQKETPVADDENIFEHQGECNHKQDSQSGKKAGGEVLGGEYTAQMANAIGQWTAVTQELIPDIVEKKTYKFDKGC